MAVPPIVFLSPSKVRSKSSRPMPPLASPADGAVKSSVVPVIRVVPSSPRRQYQLPRPSVKDANPASPPSPESVKSNR